MTEFATVFIYGLTEYMMDITLKKQLVTKGYIDRFWENLIKVEKDKLAWESFRDLFKSLVGDVSELAPVQKLQYLKASLYGEAAVVVANVELNDKGYEAACREARPIIATVLGGIGNQLRVPDLGSAARFPVDSNTSSGRCQLQGVFCLYLLNQGARTQGQVASNVAALAVTSGGPVLLSIALVTCSSNQGNTLVARALLDSGSEASFLSERFAQMLKLPKRRVHVPVAGIQGTSSGVVAHSVALTIGSPRDPGVRLHVPSVLVLPKEGLKPGPSGTPSAQATALGWVLMGHTSAQPTESDVSGVSALHVAVSCADVDQALQRFWELEEVPKDPILSLDDIQCESLYATTHSRNSQGRYMMRLPRRRDFCVPLGNNRNEALCMLVGLERRLMRNPPLREQYVAFLSEYQSLGHMSLVPTTEICSDSVYYLPHHAVFKSTDPADKIRVVFNASHRTSTSFALNDLLLPGPKLQSELWLILIRWRLFCYAFVTDIVKMFRQILVHREDTDLQRILWWPDPSIEVQNFRLVTVVYGTTSAPYLALRILIQLADDERTTFFLGADAIKTHLYVDDILAGGHSLDHALETRRQLVDILSAGGFELNKLATNAPELCPDGESSD
ncbi:hypothetical protein RF55_12326 [Lasius niger]|uniref:Peptidase A2 domain-containing protein n=1 Tax=Lasius niger TaxID=67767 RepID=A0A0J7KCR5_LASNI|nr:hypothetical protein RF55_12326 [Lasius niger]